MNICDYVHTDYQPEDALWYCPKCKSQHFYIQASINDDCPLLHNDDEVWCLDCGFAGYGSAAAQELEKLTAKSLKNV